MTPMFALLTSIGLGGVAQIALKLSLRGRSAAAPKSAASWAALLRSPWLWVYFVCFGVATGMWLLALSGLNLSYAFPLLSLSYPVVALLASLCLQEQVSSRRWLAIAVICCGVVLIVRS